MCARGLGPIHSTSLAQAPRLTPASSCPGQPLKAEGSRGLLRGGERGLFLVDMSGTVTQDHRRSGLPGALRGEGHRREFEKITAERLSWLHRLIAAGGYALLFMHLSLSFPPFMLQKTVAVILPSWHGGGCGLASSWAPQDKVPWEPRALSPGKGLWAGAFGEARPWQHVGRVGRGCSGPLENQS